MKKNSAASELVTKDYLKQELEAVEKSLRSEIKLSAEEILVKVDENAQKYRDQILTKLDETMGELGVMRDENTIGSGQTSQLREEIEDHEKRITHLEKVQQTA